LTQHQYECVACGSPQPTRTLFAGAVRCRSCGLGFRVAEKVAETLRTAYDENYYAGVEYVDYLQEKAMLQKNFARRIAYLRRWNEGGRLFEIGAAYGFFLELARQHWTVAGCDVSEAASAYARGQAALEVYCGDFTQLGAPAAGPYDLVCLWDTIEHLHHPDQVVARAAQALRPGGLLCMTTGDLDSHSARMQGRFWRLLHAPTHFYFFGRRSITRLLERNGLRVVDFEYEGSYRSLAQMAYRLLVANKDSRIGRALYTGLGHTGLLRRDAYVNLYDLMFVAALKVA
jgi:2-polyprenyl-3-methyl-5-hydroxy-6-metoxy-1,4-benzoquinol methylase